MGYKQLDYRKRCKIYGLWSAGYNQTEIAREIGVHKSTISRELNRNITLVRTRLGSWQHKPDYAQGYTNERHKRKPKRVIFFLMKSKILFGRKFRKTGVLTNSVVMPGVIICL